MFQRERTINATDESRAPMQPALSRLQELIDRSTRSARPCVADSVAFPGRQMSAAEFVDFWRGVRLVAMATVGPGGQPHIAPVHARLGSAEASGLTTLRMVIYDNALRRADLARNPKVAFTTWREDGAVAIIYGRAHEITGSLRAARSGRSGKPRQVVEVEVTLTRIYAMRPPERQAGQPSSTSCR